MNLHTASVTLKCTLARIGLKPRLHYNANQTFVTWKPILLQPLQINSLT